MISDFKLEMVPNLLIKQLSLFFPISEAESNIIKDVMPLILEKIVRCFSSIEEKYFHKNDEVFFSPFHSGQWLIFLYYISNYISIDCKSESVNCKSLADKIYYLNKIMHAVDIYHEVILPSTFFLEHPIGTVLGRAVYDDGFVAYQNCTVGGNKDKYPILGKNFQMMSGSKILGDSKVGDNVTLAANTYVKDTNIPSDVTVFGQYPNLIFKYLK